MADRKIHQLSSIIEKDKSKVLFADSVSASTTSILIGELAKIIRQNGYEIGEKRLFEWLRTNGYLISRFGTDHNAPTQRAMELKLFEVKETVINHSGGFTTISKTTKVTGKGQQYLINKFLGESLQVMQ
jgi:anti-repressor protein